jgi:hypothetical protein
MAWEEAATSVGANSRTWQMKESGALFWSNEKMKRAG